MITWPRDTPATGPFTSLIQAVVTAFISLFRIYRKMLLNRGPSRMENLNIFSIMYFSFAENTNGMIKKCKLAVRWSYFQRFLFKLKSMVYEFYVFSWLWLVLPHHVEVKLKYVKENMGKLRAWWVWRRWEQVWSWVSPRILQTSHVYIFRNQLHAPLPGSLPWSWRLG